MSFIGEKCFHVPFLGLLSSKGKMSKGSGDAVQVSQPSGSRSDQDSPLSVKSSSRGGLASVSRLVKLGRCKNVVVVAGAGISTASGIPDFRWVSAVFVLSIASSSSLSFLLYESLNIFIVLCSVPFLKLKCKPAKSL